MGVVLKVRDIMGTIACIYKLLPESEDVNMEEMKKKVENMVLKYGL